MSRQVLPHSRALRNGAALALLLLAGASLSACNTVHGAGQDVSAVGHNVSRGANATQNGLVNATGTSRN
ncbi:hypothetical protein AA103196_0741 [Ameyamaea chiangmaiensis NBRC 103196]|uniref:Entericidin A/B family lipoprotein n=1 Tax=Ameyamaea chiangmaiensis TaxID=442969 RepID=A0A850PAD0_9PROT|nr:entericidin A/B family lipoprotein [Ameyamaea chiangmaiensis]MBS4075843.1 entericidin A/B family lipoprotein [Ameyamaea chiangmaiensis]NVN39286.1 entericidin A/B family lipoprotein [Ameyamaea chiangmaiensis]GBQ63955.1 hypothetical protein AA103196_0741 [Ameyamaea chiangmaiensis NBRC 103196]